MGVEREDGLNGDIHAAEAVFLEHDLGDALAVRPRIHGGFGEEDLATRGVDAELLVEGVVPEEAHVLPVLDDAVLEGLGDLEIRAVGLCLIADHDVFDYGIPLALLGAEDGAADDGGEYCGVRERGSLGGGLLTMFREVGAGIAYFDELGVR